MDKVGFLAGALKSGDQQQAAAVVVEPWMPTLHCRSILPAFLALSLLVSACIPGTGIPSASEGPQEYLVEGNVQLLDVPPRSNFERIAVLAPAKPQTAQVRTIIAAELREEFDLVTLTMKRETTLQSLEEFLQETKPLCIVAMDNRTLRLYRDLQERHPARTFPPVIVLMASFLDSEISSLRNATGIAYEVPAVTSFVTLREVVTKEVSRIGVIHRTRFSQSIQSQSELAKTEQLELIAAVVGEAPSARDIAKALTHLIEDEQVDALWVLNDNALLGKAALQKSWIPRLRDEAIPVVVGVSALVRADVTFGTLAVVPDHDELAVQAAEMIFALADEDWRLESNQVELPVSVRTLVNLQQVRKHFGFNENAMPSIDDIIE